MSYTVLYLFVILFHVNCFTAEDKLSDKLRHNAGAIWDAQMTHPFVTEYKLHTLPMDKWRFYLVQDYLFLKEYNKVIAFAMTRAQDRHEFSRLSSLLNESVHYIDDFAKLHNLADSEMNTHMSPTTYAYTREMMTIASMGTLPEIVATLLPPTWIYEEMCRKLNISFDVTYPDANQMDHTDTHESNWTTYFRNYLDDNEMRFTNETKLKLNEIFMRSTVYEYMFWDMVYKKEEWSANIDWHCEHCGHSNVGLMDSSSERLSQKMKMNAQNEWEKHYTHPFVMSIANNSLSADKKKYFMKQNVLFLDVFNTITAMAATKTHKMDDMKEMVKHLANCVHFTKEIMNTHNISKNLGTNKMAPTNYEYTRHLLSIPYNGTLMEVITSQLARLWLHEDIEQRIGKKLIQIDSMAEKNSELKEFYMSFIDSHERMLSPGEEEQMMKIFKMGIKYELMFWDMVWKKETIE